jgi:uncharacterized protein YraI
MQLTTLTQAVRPVLPLLSLCVAVQAAAQVPVAATVTAGVHLRAGPAIVYPSVVILQPSTPVQVLEQVVRS